MKTLVALIIFTFGISTILPAQIIQYASKSLPEIALNDAERSYKIVTEYMNYDIKGSFRHKKLVYGKYTCGLENGYVQWNNVRIADSNDKEGKFPKGEHQSYMDNFKYIPSERVIAEEFFKPIPQADIFIRTLIWDVLAFETFAYNFWDDLQLNTPFLAEGLNEEVDLAGQGVFENKDIQLNWIGLTEMENETCAIIQFAAFNNPLTFSFENVTVKARSHYWGEVYVSLMTKQIVYGTMSEDVITQMSVPGNPEDVLGNSVRKISFTRE